MASNTKQDYIPVDQRSFTLKELIDTPNMSNWTDAQVADWYGTVNEIHNASKKMREFMQQAVKARMENGYLQGSEFHQRLDKQTRSTVAVDLIREKVDPEVVAECTVTNEILVMNSRRLSK